MDRPPAWEQRCLQEALDRAGFQYTVRDVGGAPELTFHYGASLDEFLSISVSVGMGAMRFVARPYEVSPRPRPEWLLYANEVSIEWGVGRLYWNQEAQAPEMACTLFASPEHVPSPEEIQKLCRELWQARRVLLPTATAIPRYCDPEDPTGAAWVADRFRASGYPLELQPDGSFSQKLDTGDEGTCLVRLLVERPGVLFIDALATACPEWPEHPELFWRLNALNARLRAVALTRWKRKLVVRRAVPTAWIPLAPDWARLTLAHLSRACVEVVRAGRGQTLDRQEETL